MKKRNAVERKELPNLLIPLSTVSEMPPPLTRLWMGVGGSLRFSRRLITSALLRSSLFGMSAAFSTVGPLVFVTSNADKLKDARHVLGSTRLIENHDADLIEIQGEPIAIARHKCEEALRLLHERDPRAMVVIEDTGKSSAFSAHSFLSFFLQPCV